MRKSLKAALACAAGAMVVGAAGTASAAMRGPGHMGGMGPPRMVHTVHPVGHGPHRFHHHFQPGFVFGIGDEYYVGDDYGGCGYYRVRWHETGSRYWRARYLDCVEG